jgi:hypothetical protein
MSENKNSFFAMAPKEKIIAFATELWRKVFDSQKDQSEQPQAEPSETKNHSLEDRLALKIRNRTESKQHSTTQPNNCSKLIKEALQSYTVTKETPKCLEKIKESLLLIKPTSIRNEGNFSLSVDFLSKKRMRMLDE